MIDLHCHILPHVDDGAASLEESLGMARICVDDGINVITATPHCNQSYRYFRKDILPRVADLNDELRRAEIPLTILPGSEIQAVDTKAYRKKFESGEFCHLGGGNSFTLLEFHWSRELVPPDAAELVSWIRQQNMIPLLAHPERHPHFCHEAGLLQGLVDAGVWLQITVDSLIGKHGPEPLKYSHQFVKQYPDVILATDSHHLQRCSGISKGFDWIWQNVGPDRAADIQRRMDHIESTLLAEQPK